MKEFVQMFKLNAEQIIWDVILKQWWEVTGRCLSFFKRDLN